MLCASLARTIGVAFLLLAAGFPYPARTAVCLSIGIATGGAYAEKRAAEVEKIFDRAGLCAKPVLVPARRLTLMEKGGELDGEAWRDDNYLAGHHSEVKVPTPVEQFSGSLFWLRENPDPSRATGATIGILAGRDWPRQALKKWPVSIFEANDYTQLFRLTESGRLQGFVMPSFLFDKLGLDSTLYHSKVIRVVPLYLVVQNRYGKLVPALDNAIKALKSGGVLGDPERDDPQSH